jgi:hypothetical protein
LGDGAQVGRIRSRALVRGRVARCTLGAILAHTRAGKPSVIQLREDDVDPGLHSGRVAEVIRRLKAELSEGAIVTIEPGRERVRILPLKPS